MIVKGKILSCKLPEQSLLFFLTSLILLWFSPPCIYAGDRQVFIVSEFGLRPEPGYDNSPLFAKAITSIKAKTRKGTKVRIVFPKGHYEFYPEKAVKRTLYISNHEQDNPKTIGLMLDDMENVTIDGGGSEFVFHGRMIPIALIRSSACTLTNFSIDFADPQIAQARILANDTTSGETIYKMEPWVDYEVTDSTLYVKGHGWKETLHTCIAFDPLTRHIIYNTADEWVKTTGVEDIGDRRIRARGWNNRRLRPGTVMAMRGWKRPSPGLFFSYNKDVTVKNVSVHYAEGMGLLAQLCNGIVLDSFSVCLKGKQDPRYFTTQADATHFSGCKGKIVVRNGIYESMMDDAINVHGTYLKIIGKEGDNSVIARYMHPQAYGFDWGQKGDKVQFVKASTMEITGKTNRIASITPVDKPIDEGVKLFRIVFDRPLPDMADSCAYGIENLTWTPKVLFEKNIIRNNRARGALFSTPRKVVVQNNLFDHVSGTGILLCGDCNGWYETGACRDVTIRHNVFDNTLTCMFQFTNAIISIYPEIPDLKGQTKYFHSGIAIEDNVFRTFDNPIVYAKSVDGLTIRRNKIINNHDFPAFHWNKKPFLLERVRRARISDNTNEKEIIP